MLLQEFIERAVLNSGQFMLSPDALEIKKDSFLTLLRMTLGTYNHYDPIDMHLHKNISSSRQYTFTEANTPEGVPEMIAEIIPIRIAGVYPFYLREFNQPKVNVSVPAEYPWEYRKPVLTVPIHAEYDIHVVYHHQMVMGPDGWHCPTINDSHEEFMALLTARFIQALGRSRAAFVMGALPIQMNGDTMVSEGKEMEEKAMESIRTNKHKFYLAWR